MKNQIAELRVRQAELMTREEYERAHWSEYPEGFFHWLNENQHIWKDFEEKALQMARMRQRYSARTIVEVMRWHSDLREKRPLFKLSNNMTPGMARLWMAKPSAHLSEKGFKP